jgi:hypothetical protein
MNTGLMFACDLYWINRRLGEAPPQGPLYASVGPAYRYDAPVHSVPDHGPSLGFLVAALLAVAIVVAARRT